MIRVLRKLAVGLPLSLALLVGTTVAGDGQGATPIANGHATVVGIPEGTTSMTFSLVELPNGSIQGHGITSNSLGGWLHFDLTSVMTIGDTVLMAGPITATFNAPPQFVIGGTFFQAVNDNGNGIPDPDELATGAVPFPLTIQEIIAITGPPPPEVFRPLLSGNVHVH